MRRLYLAIFAVSVSVIVFELNLLQILSLLQWHYFAGLVISIALLGFGASGTWISLARERLLARFETVVPMLMGLGGLSMALAIPLTQVPALRFDSYLAFVESRQAFALLMTCLLLFVPFFLCATAIGLSFVKYTAEAGRIYFWNLLGSGLGGLLAIAGMWATKPTVLAPGAGMVAALASWALLRKVSGWTRYVLFAIPIVCAIGTITPLHFRLSQFKDLTRTLELPGSEVIDEQYSPEGLVQVVSAPVLRGAPGLSLTFDEEIPVQSAVFVNGELEGFVLPWVRDDTVHLYDYATRALPYEMETAERVLILDAGSGSAVSHGLVRGASVEALENNLDLHRILRGSAAATTDSLIFHPRVSYRTASARAERAAATSYDLIVFPDVGAFGGTVGLREMSEQYALTIESISSAWDRLAPTGLLSITCWLDYPYRAPIRTVRLIAEALDGKVEHTEDHLVAVRSWADITFVVSRSRLGQHQIDNARAFSSRLSFDPLLLPGLAKHERQRFNALGDTSLFSMMDALFDRDLMLETQVNDFRISAPSDDRPYFYRFARLSRLGQLAKDFGAGTTPFFGLGLFVAILAWMVSGILALLLILAPLVKRRVGGKASLRTLLYFSSIGVGFMFVELVLIPRFTLLLGHPIYAASLVISILLVASGVGSLISDRFTSAGAATRKVTVTVSSLVLVISLLFVVVPPDIIGFPLLTRISLALLVVAPLGLVMGMPFPLGLRALEEEAPEQIPWAWGVNGCFSVVAATSASLVAVEAGLTVLSLLGAVAYVVASAASHIR